MLLRQLARGEAATLAQLALALGLTRRAGFGAFSACQLCRLVII